MELTLAELGVVVAGSGLIELTLAETGGSGCWQWSVIELILAELWVEGAGSGP